MVSSVGEFLKRADQYIRAHDFDEAERQVDKALEREPRNVYAIAYKEKVKRFRAEYEEKLRREAEERRQQEEALRAAREQLASEGEEWQRTVSQKDIEYYKELLAEAWREGLPNASKRASLEKTRSTLKISQEIHEVLEKEVKLDAYVAAVKIAWRQGEITPTKNDTLDELRRRFFITPDEHVKVESKILWEIQERRHTETIALIDDEKDFVHALRIALQGYGFTVLTATSPDEALRLLKSITPDLILLDIRFPGSKFTGFTLYEEIRKMPEFTYVPIIFLTGLKDDQSIQTGLQLGTDDYLTKPFANDTLVATIEGKLRRYQEMKKVPKG